MTQTPPLPQEQERRHRLRRLLWDYGPIGVWLRLKPLRPVLEPERFSVFLRALAERRHLPGPILEIGCFRGSTAAEAYRMLRIWGAERSYVALDTFSGFVPDQFAEDQLLGTAASNRNLFDYNSLRAVQRTFRYLGYRKLSVVQGDIVTIDDKYLPDQVSVCLLDVDLARPTQAGLRRVFPRLVPGGIILVDDCDGGASSGWRGGRIGYRRFVEELGVSERYDAGMGIVERPATEQDEST